MSNNNKIRLDQLEQTDLFNFILEGVESGIALFNIPTGNSGGGGGGGGGTPPSGLQSFSVALGNGVDHQLITYPTAYPAGVSPKVVVTLENNFNEPTFLHQISGKNNVGFTLVLSNFTQSTHYIADVVAQE